MKIWQVTKSRQTHNIIVACSLILHNTHIAPRRITVSIHPEQTSILQTESSLEGNLLIEFVPTLKAPIAKSTT